MLEAFVGLRRDRNSRPCAKLGPRAVAAANQPLSAGLGFDDHVLHDVIQPGELSGLRRPGQMSARKTGTIDRAHRTSGRRDSPIRYGDLN